MVSVFIWPYTVGLNENVSIKTTDLASDISTLKVRISVIGPEVVKSRITDVGKTLTFPNDFEVASYNVGQYYVSALDLKTNKSVGVEGFRVVDSPALTYLFEFASSPAGIATIGGIVAALVAQFYQNLSQSRGTKLEQLRSEHEIDQERKRRKADWLVGHIRSYLYLGSDAREIEQLFELNNGTYELKKDKDEVDLMFRIIRLYRSFKNYDTQTGVYYFDNYVVENFLFQLQDKLFKIFDTIFSDRDELTQFFDCEYKKALTARTGVDNYLECVKKYLRNDPGIQELPKYCLVLYWTLLIELNRGLEVTYSDPKRLLCELNRDIGPDKERFIEYVNLCNEQFFKDENKGIENEELYYKPFGLKTTSEG